MLSRWRKLAGVRRTFRSGLEWLVRILFLLSGGVWRSPKKRGGRHCRVRGISPGRTRHPAVHREWIRCCSSHFSRAAPREPARNVGLGAMERKPGWSPRAFERYILRSAGGSVAIHCLAKRQMAFLSLSGGGNSGFVPGFASTHPPLERVCRKRGVTPEHLATKKQEERPPRSLWEPRCWRVTFSRAGWRTTSARPSDERLVDWRLVDCSFGKKDSYCHRWAGRRGQKHHRAPLGGAAWVSLYRLGRDVSRGGSLGA